MAPPDTDKNADPANPVRNRNIMCTATLFAVSSADVFIHLHVRRTECDWEVKD